MFRRKWARRGRYSRFMLIDIKWMDTSKSGQDFTLSILNFLELFVVFLSAAAALVLLTMNFKQNHPTIFLLEVLFPLQCNSLCM